ncbi:MAG: hypothetical protein IPG85_16945 [Bacteroidetes bacterium]|nr:hypothetical protein [Bacteroidota bacterium]
MGFKENSIIYGKREKAIKYSLKKALHEQFGFDSFKDEERGKQLYKA